MVIAGNGWNRKTWDIKSSNNSVTSDFPGNALLAKKGLTGVSQSDENLSPVDVHRSAGWVMDISDFELKALLRSCVEGDADSRNQFQSAFGELIYNYPMMVFRLPNDRAGDFYIYVFKRDRIFVG